MGNNVIYLDDQTIIYPAGTQVVLYEVDQKTQKFLSINEPDGVSTLIASANGKSLAVAIKGFAPNLDENPDDTVERGAFIALYDLHTFKKKKTFAIPHDTTVKVCRSC